MFRDSLTTGPGGCGSGSPGIAFDRAVDRHAPELLAAVQELVRIRSVAGEPSPGAPFGTGPAEALRAALAIANRLGFPTVNLDNIVGYAESGAGDDYVAVLGHLDTVPEGEHWTYPPFGGEIHDKKIYGRGALDDKGPALAALFALKAVIESGVPLSKRVRVIFGTAEETGGTDIPSYTSRERPPVSGFTPDANFPVVFAEKGLLWIELEKPLNTVDSSGAALVSLSGGTAPNMVPEAAAAVIRTDDPGAILRASEEFPRSPGCSLDAAIEGDRVVIRSGGVSAHASTPEKGRNAIMQLLAFLATQEFGPSGAAGAIRFFARTIGTETNGASFGLALSDEPSGGLTLNAGTIDVTGTTFRITLDIRHPVTVEKDTVLDRIEASLRDTGFSATIRKYDAPLFYPTDSELIQILTAVYREATGDETPPVAIGGGTYARKLQNTVAFGPYRPGTNPPIHRRDEYVGCDELIAMAKIYARAIYALAK
ncbi:MAG: dipeptidase PepV [Methanomicrobiaceae archaeon]|nr:dipeptidase PepV [Methanomicrobiaceae archaeon]